MSEHPPEEQSVFLIRDVDFARAGFPREFRQDELALYDEVAVKHDRKAIQREYQAIMQRRSVNRLDARIRNQQTRVTALTERLKKLLEDMAADPDTWDEDALQPVEELLEGETNKLKELMTPALEQVAEDSERDDDRVNDLLRRLDDINMRAAHAIAKHHSLKPGRLTDWLKDPANADLDAAGTLVEVGVTSIPLNRAQRRALGKLGNGASSVSGR